METLLLVAERDGPEMLARIAVLKALNRHSDATPATEERQGCSNRSVIKATL
ncbi:hypothetical protein [Bradyrhizobium australiense]|uniref:Uncharacterized protein n=1 Tax=Bradyrhizobium australiense TaxID=2721161 RepID=A0A7Y4GQX6_9BRAD|nr:hypothetical protein [Bradyrhizobium australiense]NOJ40330.1 hypothetical protein [Bradyrhizobium australiense]